MAVQCSSRVARVLGLGAAATALALLGGCVVAPVDPYQVGEPVAYPAATYNGGYYYGPGYYGGYSVPYYYGPALSLGIYGGYNNSRGWRPPPPRPGWGGGPRPGGGARPLPPPRGNWSRPPGAPGPRPGFSGPPRGP